MFVPNRMLCVGGFLCLLCFYGYSSDFTGFIAADVSMFAQSPAQAAQCCQQADAGLTLSPRYQRWLQPGVSLTLEPYLRTELGSQQRSFDWREGSLSYQASSWRLIGGWQQVYWGVTETYQPVNVINQTDSRRGPQHDIRLGQLMLQYQYLPLWGELQLLLLPSARVRPQPVASSRWSLPLPVLENHYPSTQRKPEVAGRIARQQGELDWGLSALHGNQRDPVFSLVENQLSADYQQLTHYGLDMQYTLPDLLLKLELTHRILPEQHFQSVVAGFEWQFYPPQLAATELGLLLEYSYDNRNELAPATLYNHDLFIGLRWQQHDVRSTEWLLAAILDRQTSSRLFRLSASQRLSNRLLLTAEAWWLGLLSERDPAYYLRRNSYLQLELRYYF